MQEPKYKGIFKRKPEGGKSLADQFKSYLKDEKAEVAPKKVVKKEFVFKKGMKGLVVKR
jgi:hypothetical protein